MIESGTMKVFYFGSSGFSIPPLDAIRQSVSLVVTKKAKPRGRGYLSEDSMVKLAAEGMGLQVAEIETFKSDEAKRVAELAPDLVVVASFGLIIPQWFLDVPRLGAINIHPSLLPRYRGPSPIQWVLFNREQETGVTIIKMSARMDAGDILHQERVAIEGGDDAQSLSDRLSARSAQILARLLEQIAQDGLPAGVPQREEEATYTPMITKEMAKIDWQDPAIEIVGQVRALVVWPTASTSLDGQVLKVYRAEVRDETPSQPPGTVVGLAKEGMIVAAGQGTVLVKEVQLENRKKMGAYQFAMGYRDILGKGLS